MNFRQEEGLVWCNQKELEERFTRTGVIFLPWLQGGPEQQSLRETMTICREALGPGESVSRGSQTQLSCGHP